MRWSMSSVKRFRNTALRTIEISYVIACDKKRFEFMNVPGQFIFSNCIFTAWGLDVAILMATRQLKQYCFTGKKVRR